MGKTAARLAQLDKRWSAEREAAGSLPARATLRLFKVAPLDFLEGIPPKFEH